MLEQNLEIKTLQGLKNIISEIKQCIRDKKMEQFWPRASKFCVKEHVCNIEQEGPFPDYIEWYFRELETKKEFELSVETYHGAGGHWRIIAPSA